ncbi:hypothetical protein B0H19DRAFT_1366380 [Mycena capillaripes]|nr:hypothetical protein B0H19DRAFT_1366380 [Mycena capillaripes]
MSEDSLLEKPLPSSAPDAITSVTAHTEEILLVPIEDDYTTVAQESETDGTHQVDSEDSDITSDPNLPLANILEDILRMICMAQESETDLNLLPLPSVLTDAIMETNAKSEVISPDIIKLVHVLYTRSMAVGMDESRFQTGVFDFIHKLETHAEDPLGEHLNVDLSFPKKAIAEVNAKSPVIPPDDAEGIYTAYSLFLCLGINLTAIQMETMRYISWCAEVDTWYRDVEKLYNNTVAAVKAAKAAKIAQA